MSKYFNLKNATIAAGLVLTVMAITFGYPNFAAAQDVSERVCDSLVLVDTNCDDTSTDIADNIVGTVTGFLVFATVAISGIAIIIGAIRYVTSNGDPNEVKQAKDTIIYAVIAIIVAAAAQGIVALVITGLN